MQKTCHADTEKTSDYLISLLADACLTFLRVREVKRRVYIAAKNVKFCINDNKNEWHNLKSHKKYI